MKLHQFAKMPPELILKMSNTQLEFLLSLLTQAHVSLVTTWKDVNAAPEDRKEAYDSALNTELLYSDIFKQLKLNRPERADLN